MNFFSLFNNKLSPKIQSKIHGTITIENRYRKKALVTKNVTQSGGEITYMWKKIIAQLKKQNRTSKNALVLGVGAADVVSVVKKAYPNSSITGVEIDPAIIEVSKRYFSLDTAVFSRLIITDAIAWVKKQKAQKKYNLIVVDLFVGALNPKNARKKQFLQKLKMLLTQKGTILYNSHYQQQEEFEEFLNMCVSIFPKAEVVFQFKLNRLILLSTN